MPEVMQPPQFGNTFADYTKKQRAKFTNNNLMKHAHKMEENAMKPNHNRNRFMPMNHHAHSPQYIHQLPHYNLNYQGTLPHIPPPQLTPRLSVNSLPALMHHHQTQKQ
eukprot:415323_1